MEVVVDRTTGGVVPRQGRDLQRLPVQAVRAHPDGGSLRTPVEWGG
jgi:hypothetical protein